MPIVAERFSPSQSTPPRSDGTVSTPYWTGGFRNPAFCTLIPISALTPFILGKSRMHKRARTDLCGGAASDGRPYRDSNPHGPVVVVADFCSSTISK
jgi:hypothetical protein